MIISSTRPLLHPLFHSFHSSTLPLFHTHQHTNTPPHQHTNTPPHQHTNTPRHQHTNTPTRQHTNTPTHQRPTSNDNIFHPTTHTTPPYDSLAYPHSPQHASIRALGASKGTTVPTNQHTNTPPHQRGCRNGWRCCCFTC